MFKVYICTVIPSLEAMIPLSREAFVKMGVSLVPDLVQLCLRLVFLLFRLWVVSQRPKFCRVGMMAGFMNLRAKSCVG